MDSLKIYNVWFIHPLPFEDAELERFTYCGFAFALFTFICYFLGRLHATAILSKSDLK